MRPWQADWLGLVVPVEACPQPSCLLPSAQLPLQAPPCLPPWGSPSSLSFLGVSEVQCEAEAVP